MKKNFFTFSYIKPGCSRLCNDCNFNFNTLKVFSKRRGHWNFNDIKKTQFVSDKKKNFFFSYKRHSWVTFFAMTIDRNQISFSGSARLLFSLTSFQTIAVWLWQCFSSREVIWNPIGVMVCLSRSFSTLFNELAMRSSHTIFQHWGAAVIVSSLTFF